MTSRNRAVRRAIIRQRLAPPPEQPETWRDFLAAFAVAMLLAAASFVVASMQVRP